MVLEVGGGRTSKHASLPKVKENAVCLFGGIARLLGGEFEAEGKNASSHLMVRGKDPLPENVADVSWKGPRGREALNNPPPKNK